MKLIIGILLFFLFISFCKLNNTSSDNLYVLHTRDGDIECNYHNSIGYVVLTFILKRYYPLATEDKREYLGI